MTKASIPIYYLKLCKPVLDENLETIFLKLVYCLQKLMSLVL